MEVNDLMTAENLSSSHVLSVEQFVAGDSPLLPAGRSRCAVIGRPIAHSLSPLLHNTAYQHMGLDHVYVAVEGGEPEDFQRLLEASGPEVRGFSVTMPGKQAALAAANEVTDRARQIGAANTLVHRPDGSWLADNTDVDGVLRCIEHLTALGVNVADSQVVIVGNGGTARPAMAAAAAAGAAGVTVLARSEQRAGELAPLAADLGLEFGIAVLGSAAMRDACAAAAIVVNTIPAHVAEQYVEALLLARSVIDVIYEPNPTPLLQAATAKGLPVADGLRMLAGQAERQCEYFTGLQPPQGLMLETVLH